MDTAKSTTPDLRLISMPPNVYVSALIINLFFRETGSRRSQGVYSTCEENFEDLSICGMHHCDQSTGRPYGVKAQPEGCCMETSPSQANWF